MLMFLAFILHRYFQKNNYIITIYSYEITNIMVKITEKKNNNKKLMKENRDASGRQSSSEFDFDYY